MSSLETRHEDSKRIVAKIGRIGKQETPEKSCMKQPKPKDGTPHEDPGCVSRDISENNLSPS